MELPQNKSLSEVDPEIFNYINDERERQVHGLELIASENFTSKAVQEALGSCATNKYSEGLPGKRYYGGNEVIDKIENLCIKRALEAFHLDPNEWGCNVQPYSGSVANLGAYVGAIQPGDTLMGLALASGGHLTHGHQTEAKKISVSALFYNSIQYGLDQETGLINYDEVDRLADEHKPKLIITGASAYPRDWDYKRFRETADRVGALLMSDIAHIAGLVAAQELADPFKYCDIITTTTHKSLRGPRSGIIFFRKGPKKDINGNVIEGETYNLEAPINFAVFPSIQGGPHEHQIAAVAVAMKEVADPSFKEYAIQVRANAKALAEGLKELGHKIVTDGTDNHLLLWNLRDLGLTGSKVEKACDIAHITVNKNMIVGDKSALAPGGVRLGSPALTSRGMKEADMKVIAGFLDRVAKIAVRIQETVGKQLVEFNKAAVADEELLALGKEVQAFSSTFGIPGKAL
eukprot:TRINITY_DN14348_c0_g1_i1.p2 TRINITY_DN14348_c0_g1~~TRINITY_DN14348_c0_g1_i1.p2  ORF type:complete len:462 (-),score=151.79 TRINITY_DN14348_c0_g1_i1:46-1431(-)